MFKGAILTVFFYLDSKSCYAFDVKDDYISGARFLPHHIYLYAIIGFDHKSHMDMKRDLAIKLIILSNCLNPFHLDICDFCYLFIFSFISSNIGLLCLNRRTNEGIVFTSLIIVSLFQLQYGYWYLFCSIVRYQR